MHIYTYTQSVHPYACKFMSDSRVNCIKIKMKVNLRRRRIIKIIKIIKR